MKHRLIVVSQSNGKGRGVFASTLIPAGTLIHVAHVIVIPDHEIGDVLDRYVYTWSDNESAIALGIGSLFNHSCQPNVGFVRQMDQLEIEYTTLREIAHTEELTIDYGYEPLGYIEG